jgi:DNA-binding transcriptional regulator GbsR (MarR family)
LEKLKKEQKTAIKEEKAKMENTDPFIQIKIDYVQYMMQLYNVMAYDETITGILFALMLENYLTANDLEVLTGLSKPTINKALSRISVMFSEFPILQTKKPRDRKKYYYCPLSLEPYIKHNFLAVMTASEISLSFIPSLLSRLDALSPQTSAIIYIRRTLLYLYIAIYYYKETFTKVEPLIDRMLQEPDYVPDFSAFLKAIHFELPPQELKIKDDTLLDIKRDFISNMIELSSELIGGEDELISVFLAMFLEDEPVTQDELITVTKSSRTKVSQALSKMEELKIVRITKKPGQRKKYYKGAASIEQYGVGKLGRVQGYYAQIQMMMQKKFLPELKSITVTEESDKTEKERLTKFFKDNIFYYDVFIRFSTAMHETMRVELKNALESIL